MTQSENTPVATAAKRWTTTGCVSTVWRRWLLLIASILMSSGCTYSTNPIFVEQDNLFDEASLGTWEADEEAKFEFRRFEVKRWGPEEKSYRAVLRNENGEKQEPSFQLFLSQIDGKKFITAKFENPSSEKDSPDAAAAAAIYLTFAIDRIEGGELRVRYLLGDCSSSCWGRYGSCRGWQSLSLPWS
jgi:hypothetical protein